MQQAELEKIKAQMEVLKSKIGVDENAESMLEEDLTNLDNVFGGEVDE